MSLDRWRFLPHLDESFPLPLDSPFTRAQALREGVPRHWLTELARLGLLRHPVRDCYVAAQAPDDLACRIACLRLVAPADAVVVDRHAGWVHGANMLLRPNEHLNVLPVAMYLPAGRGRLRNSLADSGERTFREDDLTTIDGLRLTTPLRTALDLGRQRWPEPALTALDALHRLGSFTREELISGIERFRGMRWVSTLRLVAPHVDGRSQSGGESVVRWRWLHLPVPPPEPQVEVSHGAKVAYIDVGHAATCFGIEFQGLEWHTGPGREARDEARFAWLAQEAGWLIEPVWTPDVYGPSSRIEDIIVTGFARALKRARARHTQ